MDVYVYIYIHIHMHTVGSSLVGGWFMLMYFYCCSCLSAVKLCWSRAVQRPWMSCRWSVLRDVPKKYPKLWRCWASCSKQRFAAANMSWFDGRDLIDMRCGHSRSTISVLQLNNAGWKGGCQACLLLMGRQDSVPVKHHDWGHWMPRSTIVHLRRLVGGSIEIPRD